MFSTQLHRINDGDLYEYPQGTSRKLEDLEKFAKGGFRDVS